MSNKNRQRGDYSFSSIEPRWLIFLSPMILPRDNLAQADRVSISKILHSGYDFVW